jgi:putative nucleotidyltransferase with HDIG domain
VLGVLCIYAAEPDAFDTDEVNLLAELADDLSYGIAAQRTAAERDQIVYEHQHHLEALKKSLVDSIQAIATTLEMRDPYTAGHEKRVAQLAVAIAREMGLSEQQIEGIHFGSLIHDIGKIQVPAEILSYPGKLSKIQFDLIKTHAQAGYDILKGITFPWPVADMVLQHHERLDGSGYPQGLKNDEVIIEARILAVADTVEAMSSHRPYRPGLGIDRALDEISRNRGIRYDPSAVDACMRLFKEKGFTFELADLFHPRAAFATWV